MIFLALRNIKNLIIKKTFILFIYINKMYFFIFSYNKFKMKLYLT